MTFRADLHCHSNCSDGSLTPRELIAHAKAVGLSGISITDHDSINAYPSAIAAAKEMGIWLGSGVEFSSIDQGVSVHVLGYDFDINHSGFNAFCKRHLNRRKERNQKILEKLAKRKMFIEIEEKEDAPIGRPHIALALVEKGYASTVQEAFNQLIGDGRPCFDPGISISTDETLEVIHLAGGKAFIAHPHLIRPSSHVRSLLKKPFNGIECYYGKNPPHEEKKWVKLAQEKGLLMSGGSDFHGKIKPSIPLGCSWVNQETFEKIFETHKWK